jgi:hypothetical protein
MKKISFNQHFGVSANQDYINILLASDLKIFIDPYNIANNKQHKIAQQLYDRMKMFLETLNRSFIVTNDRRHGIPFLSHLQEANEYGFGYSENNKGKGIGPTKAEVIFNALANNKFARAGVSITNEAHNVLLLVKGIGQDNMSDTIANVCRDLFAAFTLEQCLKHGVGTFPTPIEYFDPITRTWTIKTVQLPRYMLRELILVPKFLALGKRAYSSRYNWFIASNHIAPDIINGKINPSKLNTFVNTHKDGTKKAIIKNINKYFKKPKEGLVDFVMQYSGSLEEFQQHVKDNFPTLDDIDLANLIGD